ncbi:MAG: toll/interleukin-1 receptor domain-containing protein [Bacteroidota bacterium]
MFANNFKRRCDVFISYAIEDKNTIAKGLYERLTKAKINVWYAGMELSVGDSIDDSIKKGLNSCRYGIVILSHRYLEKHWTKKELYALWQKEHYSRKVILPVWYNITEAEIRKKDAVLSDRFGLKTEMGLDYVAEKLAREIRKGMLARNVLKIVLTFVFCSLVFAAYSFFNNYGFEGPEKEVIESTIQQRIEDMHYRIEGEHKTDMITSGGKLGSIEKVKALFVRFTETSSRYRNYHSFDNQFLSITAKKNVEPLLNVEFDALTPFNFYGMDQPEIYIVDKSPSPESIDANYILLNTKPVRYEIIKKEFTNEYQCFVRVRYENNIRYFSVRLNYSSETDWKKIRNRDILGMLPQETYVFEKSGDQWTFVGLAER